MTARGHLTAFGYLKSLRSRDPFTVHTPDRRDTCLTNNMQTIPYEAPVLNEEIWNAWLAKTNRQEKLAAIGFAISHFAL